MILGAGAAIAWITFSNVGDALPTVSGLIVAALCGLIVMAAIAVLAFYHVGGRGLEEWAIVGLLYILAPKHYVWTFNFDELDEEQQNAAQLEQEKEESEW